MSLRWIVEEPIPFWKRVLLSQWREALSTFVLALSIPAFIFPIVYGLRWSVELDKAGQGFLAMLVQILGCEIIPVASVAALFFLSDRIYSFADSSDEESEPD